MANHKSALKRIRRNEAVRLRNRYQHKTTRNAIKKLRGETSKKKAEALLPAVVSMIDKLAKRNIIHDNKAANLKSKLTKQVATLKSWRLNTKHLKEVGWYTLHECIIVNICFILSTINSIDFN